MIMKKYNLGIKIQPQNGFSQPIKLLSMPSWMENDSLANHHRVNFNESLRTILNEGRSLRGYSPTDLSVAVFIGPDVLKKSIIETTLIEVEQV
jgi:hypothetical protein